MLCIFVVIGAVILSVVIMNYLTERLANAKAAKEAAGDTEEIPSNYLDPKVSWSVFIAALALVLIIALAVILPIA